MNHFIDDALKDNKITFPDQAAPLRPMKKATEIREFWKVRRRYSSSFEAFIPIQNGCDKFCTFCAVPYTR